DVATFLHAGSVLLKRMPGEGVVGVFIPVPNPEIVYWRDLISKKEAQMSGFKIPLLLGVDWQGRVFMDDLVKVPHLLIAGSTGGGKSVELRSLLATIVQLMNSNAVQLLLSDTKGL